MSKLYDQLKNAAFARRAALERKSKPRAPAAAGDKPPRALSEQKIVADQQWRETIESKLQEAERQLVPSASPPPLEPLTEIRGREATLAKLEEASQLQAALEADALLRAREREDVERSLHAR